MKPKFSLKLFFTFIVLICQVSVGLANQKKLSIIELATLTQSYWETNLYFNGEQVIVPIYIPNVEQMPVLRVQWDRINESEFQALFGNDLVLQIDEYGFSNYKNVCTSADGARYIQTQINRIWSDKPMITYSSFCEEGDNAKEINTDYKNVYAQNQAMSLADAMEWAQNAFDNIYENSHGGIFIDSVEISSPYLYYKDGEYGGNYPVDNLTGIGCYSLCGMQTIRGIPILDTIYYGVDLSSLTNLTIALSRKSTANVMMLSSDESYVLYGKPWIESGILAEDIPLCPIETVIANIQKEIDSGRIKNIYSLMLGYVVFGDDSQTYSKHPWDNEQFLLIPTWICECSYVADPNKDYVYPKNENADAYNYRGLDWFYEKWMFNAQTGKRYQSGKGDKKYYTNIETW